MKVAHKAAVLVADGRKLMFVRNEGDAQAPDLHVEVAQEHPSRDRASDAGGRASSGGGGGAPAGAS